MVFLALVILWGLLLFRNQDVTGACELVPADYRGKAMPEGWKGDPKVLSAGKAIYVVEAKPSVKYVMVRTASLRKLAVERRIFPTIRRSALKVLMLSGSGEFQKGSARP